MGCSSPARRDSTRPPTPGVTPPARRVINRRTATGRRTRYVRSGATATTDIASEGTSKFSMGEPHGTNKNVGTAVSRSRDEMESEGILRDMWKALRYLSEAHQAVIQSVEWFTFNDGFKSTIEPRLIGLQPYDDDDDGRKAPIRTWVYFEPFHKVPRGLLVVRVVAGAKVVFIVEVQRRSHEKSPNRREKKRALGQEKEYVEETYQGLVFTLEQDASLELWLRDLGLQIREAKGIMKKIRPPESVQMFTFNHATAVDEVCCCEAAARNALSKAGVHL